MPPLWCWFHAENTAFCWGGTLEKQHPLSDLSPQFSLPAHAAHLPLCSVHPIRSALAPQHHFPGDHACPFAFVSPSWLPCVPLASWQAREGRLVTYMYDMHMGILHSHAFHLTSFLYCRISFEYPGGTLEPNSNLDWFWSTFKKFWASFQILGPN